MTAYPVFYPAPAAMPFSAAVRVPGFLLLSGQIPFDDAQRPHSGSIAEQTHAVLRSISKTLQELGSSLDKVVKVNVWLSDLANFAAFNEVYRGYFDEGCYPVRSLVQAQLAFGGGVEIEVKALDVAAPAQ